VEGGPGNLFAHQKCLFTISSHKPLWDGKNVKPVTLKGKK
jgi:hypothetical protein